MLTLCGIAAYLAIGGAMAYMAWTKISPEGRRQLRPGHYLILACMTVCWVAILPLAVEMAARS
jgi:hypothetical protein